MQYAKPHTNLETTPLLKISKSTLLEKLWKLSLLYFNNLANIDSNLI